MSCCGNTGVEPDTEIRAAQHADDLLDLYNATLLGLVIKHAPEKEKVVPNRPSSVDGDDDELMLSVLRCQLTY